MRWGRRNPRRYYDREGREQPPATVGSVLDCYKVQACCETCVHCSDIDHTRWPAAYPLPDIALHLLCTGCGAKGDRISVQVSRRDGAFRP